MSQQLPAILPPGALTGSTDTHIAPAHIAYAGDQAIADNRKAAGQPQGVVELMVFYCEKAAGFSAEYGQR
jgi:hypothetical protein